MQHRLDRLDFAVESDSESERAAADDEFSDRERNVLKETVEFYEQAKSLFNARFKDAKAKLEKAGS